MGELPRAISVKVGKKNCVFPVPQGSHTQQGGRKRQLERKERPREGVAISIIYH